MKTLVTENDLRSLGTVTHLDVPPGAIVTPSARDYASRHGIELRAAGPKTESVSPTGRAGDALDTAIREAVRAELGSVDETVVAAVRSAATGAAGRVRDNQAASSALNAVFASGQTSERAILSAMGENRQGILARLTGVVSEHGADIVNVSQTIVEGYFTMILVMNLDEPMSRGMSFRSLRDALVGAANGLGLEAMLVHENVLRAMHRV